MTPASRCRFGDLDRARSSCKRRWMLVYAVVDDALSATFPLGDALEVYVAALTAPVGIDTGVTK